MDPDYIRASDGNGEAIRSIVTFARGIGDSDLIVDSVLNYPNKFIATVGMLDEGTGLFDPDTITIFYGTLTGSIITIDEFAPGYTDVGNQVNESVVLKPTTAWADLVAEQVQEPGLPAGGIDGQILTKLSATDGDADWEDGASGIYVGPDPPPDPEEDDFWLDEDEVGEAGSIGFASGSIPTGTINGTNTTFTAPSAYIAGSLQVFLNGIAQIRVTHFLESNPATGVFDFTTAPSTGDLVHVNYQTAAIAANNAAAIDGYSLDTILESLYPVGSVFISGQSSMPALIAGIGTWVRIEGRMIVGLDSAQTEFDTVNETGGAKTHTLTLAQIPNATGQIVGHSSRSAFWAPNGVFGTSDMAGTYEAPAHNTGGANSIANLNFSLGGGGGSHPIMNPYKVKYMWERTV